MDCSCYVTSGFLDLVLVRTCHERVIRGEPFPMVRQELLRAASWRAARSGLDGDLIHVCTECAIPAKTLIEQFLDFLRPALEVHSDGEEISALVSQTM